MAAEKKQGRKTKIFISYSRKNKTFVRKLHDAVVAADFEAWVDWEQILPSADWMAEINIAIQDADAYIFIISPYSITSKVCNEELALAIKYNKKIIPVLFADPQKGQKMHSKLAALNWVSVRAKNEEFKSAIALLKESIETDLEWVQQHTRLIGRAREWADRNKNRGYLLQGSELEDSERWLAESTVEGTRRVLPLQAEYINQSRKAAVTRTRAITIMVSAALIMSIFLGIYALLQRNTAVANEQRAINSQAIAVFNEKARAAQQIVAEENMKRAEENERIAKAQRSASDAKIYQEKPSELDVSTLLAIDSYQQLPNPVTENILRHNISLLATPINQMDANENSNQTIRDIILSPNSQEFASIGIDGEVCVWKAEDGAKVFCASQNGAIFAAVFSADGDTLITGSDIGELTSWNARSGAELKSLQFTGSIFDLALHPDGKRLGVARSKVISLVDITTMRESFYFTQTSDVNVIVFDPGGLRTAIGSAKGYVSIWLINGQAVSGARHTNQVADLAFSPDNRWLISVGADSSARATKIGEGNQKYSIMHGDRVVSVDFGPDSAWFVTASEDNFVRVIDTELGQERMRMAHANFVAQARVSANGKWIASVSGDRTARVWDAASGAELLRIPLGSEGSAIEFNADSTRLLIGDEHGNLTLWDISRLKSRANSILFPQAVSQVQFSPNGKWLVANSDDQNIWMIANDSASAPQKFVTAKGSTAQLTISPDSNWIAAIEYDHNNSAYNRVIVANATGVDTFVLENEGKVIQALAFLPDNQHIIVAYEDSSIVTWNISRHKQISTLPIETDIILSMDVSPDGKYLALGLEQANYSLIWDLQNGSVAATLPQTGKIRAVQFTRDGKFLATASSESTVYLWNIADSSFTKTEKVFNIDSEALTMDFSPDNTILAVGDSTGYIYLFDIALNQEVARMPHIDKVTALSFSTDGQRLAVVSRKTITLWDLPSTLLIKRGDLINVACSRLIKNFTKSKWETLFFNQEYHLTCPNLPAGED